MFVRWKAPLVLRLDGGVPYDVPVWLFDLARSDQVLDEQVGNEGLTRAGQATVPYRAYEESQGTRLHRISQVAVHDTR